MSKTQLSLAGYVKKINGVPLGASGSLSNMLSNSLGASSFLLFWRYWNPIWGYYLARFIMRPVSNVLPNSLATLVTFGMSGLLHDIAIMILKLKVVFICTPLFLLFGVVVVMTELLKLNFTSTPWMLRVSINLFWLAGSAWLSLTFLTIN